MGNEAASANAAEQLEASINNPISPYMVVQDLIDHTADFNLYAAPDLTYAHVATLTPGHPEDSFGINGGYGMDFQCRLHGFDAGFGFGSHGVSSSARTGGQVGVMHARLFFAPSQPPWSPGEIPEAAIYDPARSKSFVIPNACFDFGKGEKVYLHITGQTYPALVHGNLIQLATGAGNVMKGTGRFAGLSGSLSLNGRLTPDLAFAGDLVLRMVDFGRVFGASGWPGMEPQRAHNDGAFYIVMRGQKPNPRALTKVGPPCGNEQQLITPSVMRPLAFACSDGTEGIRTGQRQGAVVATMEAGIYSNLTAVRKNEEDSVPFSTQETYRFYDRRQNEVGVLTAGIRDGISFDLTFPRRPQQPGLRFAGGGPITGGTGVFQGAVGLLTVNSLIGISPHELSLIHVFQIVGGRAAECGD